MGIPIKTVSLIVVSILVAYFPTPALGLGSVGLDNSYTSSTSNSVGAALSFDLSKSDSKSLTSLDLSLDKSASTGNITKSQDLSLNHVTVSKWTFGIGAQGGEVTGDSVKWSGANAYLGKKWSFGGGEDFQPSLRIKLSFGGANYLQSIKGATSTRLLQNQVGASLKLRPLEWIYFRLSTKRYFYDSNQSTLASNFSYTTLISKSNGAGVGFVPFEWSQISFSRSTSMSALDDSSSETKTVNIEFYITDWTIELGRQISDSSQTSTASLGFDF